VMSFFQYIDVLGNKYLQSSQLEQEFGDEEWMKYMPVAVVMMLVYPLGIPGFFFVALYTRRQRLMDPDVRVTVRTYGPAQRTDPRTTHRPTVRWTRIAHMSGEQLHVC
jgi:hypothetical protein